MYAVLASAVDVLHALFMVAWIAGLPLLFWHRWPRLTRAYAVFAIVFAIVNQVSRAFLGECFLTTMSRALWMHDASAAPTDVHEWFSVRFAEAVFHLTPTHRAIKIATEVLIVVLAVGTLFSLSRLRTRKRAPQRAA